jgi:hypothetical protein
MPACDRVIDPLIAGPIDRTATALLMPAEPVIRATGLPAPPLFMH